MVHGTSRGKKKESYSVEKPKLRKPGSQFAIIRYLEKNLTNPRHNLFSAGGKSKNRKKAIAPSNSSEWIR